MPEKIEKQEVWFIDGGYQSFHAQAIPVLFPTYIVIGLPHQTYSWIIPFSAIKKCKLNLKVSLKEESKIVSPKQTQVILK